MMKSTSYIFVLLVFVLVCANGIVSAGNEKADQYLNKAARLIDQGFYLEAARIAKVFFFSGYCFHQSNQYSQAMYYYKYALEIYSRLGEEEKMATLNNNIGLLYDEWGEYKKALKHFNSALEINKRLGEEGEAATNYNNIGLLYNRWANYDKALAYYNKSLEINKRLGDEVSIAIDYNNMGTVYKNLGKYMLALQYYEKALEIDERLEREEELARDYNSIALVYNAWGRYEIAMEYYIKSLELVKRLGIEDKVAIVKENIGMLYYDWGDYEKSLDYLLESLEIDERLGKKRRMALGYNSIGLVYNDWGRHDKALEYYNKSLEISMSLGLENQLAVTNNNLAGLYYNQGRYDKALEYFNKALEIANRLGNEARLAVIYSNIGIIYHELGEHDIALNFYTKSLEIFKKLGNKGNMAVDYNNIGYLYTFQKKYDKAAECLLESIRITESIRAEAPTDELKRYYLQKMIETYQQLISVYIKSGQVGKAYIIIELSRAKVLAESLIGRRMELSIPSLQEVQHQLDSSQGLLIYANSNRDDIVEMALTSGSKEGIAVAKQEFVQNIMAKYGAEIDMMIKKKKRIKEIQSFNMNNTDLLERERDSKDQELENIIYYYRECLTASKDIEYIARQLYRLLIKPIEDQIMDKDELIIAPDGILNFIPFETLIDEKGDYLVQKYRIGYIQSETVSSIIRDRGYPEDRKELLAFGGAVYEKEHATEEVIENEKQLMHLKNQVDRVLEERGPVDTFYSRLGYGSWNNLPGTLLEVKGIREIITDGDITTGKDVREEKIKELSRKGILAQYKVLHFATHGIVVTEVPELSAIVLSQLKEEGEEDGYLRMDEIIDLDIKADFVNLSACNTGLGKVFAGEGVVGLTQSFLLAGANSLSVSLWSVADETTAEFMVSLYKLVKNEDISYKEAMHEVKLRFIDGSFGEAYQHPYYWAPFVYYGR